MCSSDLGAAKAPDAILFSESQGRLLLSVPRAARKQFERLFIGIPLSNIGEVVQAASLSIRVPNEKVELSLEQLTENYRSFFKLW